jgi:hypothetical protein
MIVEAMFPYGHLGQDWPGRERRRVDKLARTIAKNVNPKRGLSEAELLSQLQDTFGHYMAVAGASSGRTSIASRAWRAYFTWALDPSLKIADLLAGEGLENP